MAKRTKFTVQPNGDRWDIVSGGGKVSTHDTKGDAVERGRKLGNSTPNSQLVIKKRDGKIQTEHTYGNDPKRYPG